MVDRLGTGLPIPERAGMLRYYVRVAEKTIWAGSARGVGAIPPTAGVMEDGEVTRLEVGTPQGGPPSVRRRATVRMRSSRPEQGSSALR